MPAPVAVGVYVLAAVGTVAAGFAFKEFVYEPHIAPRVERWAEEFLAKRKARKMKRAGKHAVAVPSTSGAGTAMGGNDTDLDAAVDADGKSTYELENLVADEVRQWRSQVDVHTSASSGLRHRKTRSSTAGSALDESNIIIPYDTLTPTHILFDPTDGMSVSASSPASTSTISSRVATPGPEPSPHSTLSHSTFRTPPPLPVVQAPPTPEPSVHGSTPASPTPSRSPARGPTPNQEQDAQDPFLFSISSPHNVPSLSLSHPLDLDLEADRDLELLSAPSSRPSSPFSDGDFSIAHEQFHSFTTLSPGPELRVLSASGSEADGEELERWSSTGSEVSGSESSWASADTRSR